LLRKLFGGTHGYISLEPPDVRAAASSDPRGFLKQHPGPVVLDEVQYAPELLPYLKETIDESRDEKGRYLLTGSQNLMLMQKVTESLAGRVAVLKLLPLSCSEISGRPDTPFPWETGRISGTSATKSGLSLWNSLVRGGFPELWQDPARDAALWHSSYLQTYLERDVRQLRQVGDLTQFQGFVRLLASRSAQLLNVTDIGRDLGIAANTVRAWISVLEATHQVVVLRPYHANVGKRLVKTPKIFFTDVGLLCHLVGLKDAEHAAGGPMAGALFETAVFLEMLKRMWNRGEDLPLHFWRTSAGSEVDFLISTQDKFVPVEAKASCTPKAGMAGGMAAFRRDLGAMSSEGYVVHAGDVRLPLVPGITAVPFDEF
jgi:predicted AAA+ superfamily ATPase